MGAYDNMGSIPPGCGAQEEAIKKVEYQDLECRLINNLDQAASSFLIPNLPLCYILPENQSYIYVKMLSLS